VADIGSRCSWVGMSRWSGIRHSHEVNWCHMVIGVTCGPCGSSGSDWRPRRR
jgi:hypothetical protein